MTDTKIVRTFDETWRAFSHEDQIAVDLETGGFSPWRDPIHVVVLYGPKSDTISILHYPDGRVPHDVLEWLADAPELVMHNGSQFDMLFLAQNGMDWEKPEFYDTLLGERAVLGVERWNVKVNLRDTVNRRLGEKLDKSIDHSKWSNSELDQEQIDYCAGDIKFLTLVQQKQREQAQENNTIQSIQNEMAVARPVIRMGLNGVPVDMEALERYFELKKEEHATTTAYLLSELGDIMLSSNVQLRRALGEKFGERRFPDTKAERLQLYGSQNAGDLSKICLSLLEWRHFTQRRNMFGDKWKDRLEAGPQGETRVHGKLWQLGAATGRFTSSDPNLQQIPRDMKHVFGNVPGLMMGKSDFASIEVRVAAALSGDDVMIEAINSGEDIHRVVGSAMFGIPPEDITHEQRRIAKAGSFTFLFGGSVDTFMAYAANNGSIIEEEDAVQAYENFFNRFQGVRRMRDITITQANSGYPRVIVYPTGLRRVIAGSELRHTVILNNVVQGTAAAGLKFALVEAEKRGIGNNLLAVVHDEVVYEAEEKDIEEVRREVDQAMIVGMQRALEGGPAISIGVESTYGPTWKGDPANEVATESGV